MPKGMAAGAKMTVAAQFSRDGGLLRESASRRSVWPFGRHGGDGVLGFQEGAWRQVGQRQRRRDAGQRCAHAARAAATALACAVMRCIVCCIVGIDRRSDRRIACRIDGHVAGRPSACTMVALDHGGVSRRVMTQRCGFEPGHAARLLLAMQHGRAGNALHRERKGQAPSHQDPEPAPHGSHSTGFRAARESGRSRPGGPCCVGCQGATGAPTVGLT